jgi:hypothetical protein
MPDTIDVKVFNNVWTEVQQGVSGLITNDSEDDIRIREAAVKPDVSVKKGHIIHPHQDITYGVEGTQKIFARSVRAESLLIVTEG